MMFGHAHVFSIVTCIVYLRIDLCSAARDKAIKNNFVLKLKIESGVEDGE